MISSIFRIEFLDWIAKAFENFAFLFPDMQKAIEIRDEVEWDFIKIFAKHGNFTINSIDIGTNTFDRIFPYVHFNLFTTHFWDTAGYHFGSKFFQETNLIATTPGIPYNSYEKLVLPFDEITWLLLIITLCFAFGVTAALNLLSQNQRRLFFGEGFKLKTFDISAISFGIGQTCLPSQNFGRVLLTFFIFFCLVMRTGYQGMIN